MSDHVFSQAYSESNVKREMKDGDVLFRTGWLIVTLQDVDLTFLRSPVLLHIMESLCESLDCL